MAKTLRDSPSLSKTMRTRMRIISFSHTTDGAARPVKTIAGCAGCSENTVYKVLRLYKEKGMNALYDYNRSPAQNSANQKVGGREEAEIISIACSTPPDGHARWTLDLIRTRLRTKVKLEVSISTIGNVLRRNKLKPHLSESWCIPTVNGEYLMCMEDVLDVYERPYNPMCPVVCMDEKPYQLLDDILAPVPMTPGHKQKEDYEYSREGVVSIFTYIEPLIGRVHASPRKHRTAQDWALEIRYLCDVMYPDAEKIVLVMDNLNTHKPGNLYETFEPAEAHRLARRLEIHYTPKHASWLNIAEIAINIMSTMCLNRRIPNIDTLIKELKAWEEEYNATHKKVDWQFTTEKARTKLSHLYPTYDADGEKLIWPKRPIRRGKNQSGDDAASD